MRKSSESTSSFMAAARASSFRFSVSRILFGFLTLIF